jgi:hypothetical protein
MSEPLGSPAAADTLWFDTQLGPNPFPVSDPGHQRWIETSRALAEDLARVHVAHLAAGPRTLDASTMTEWIADGTLAIFDATTRARLVVVVTGSGYAGAQRFRDLLDMFVTDALNAAERCRAHQVTIAEKAIQAHPHEPTGTATVEEFISRLTHDRLIAAVRPRLRERQAHWWLQACEMARAQESERATSAAASPGERSTPNESRAAVDGSMRSAFPKRAAWLQRMLDERRWTVHTLDRWGGPSWKTARKILRGEAVTQSVLETLARTLSRKGTIAISDIPND